MRFYQLSPNQPLAAPQAHLPMVYVSRSDAWEYHVLDVPADELPAQEALNQLGKEGWELGQEAGDLHLQAAGPESP